MSGRAAVSKLVTASVAPVRAAAAREFSDRRGCSVRELAERAGIAGAG